MRSFAFLLIACGFTFLGAFKDAQGLVETKSGKMSSSFHRIKRARMESHSDVIIPRNGQTKCEKLRAEALEKIKEGEIFVFVPKCRADGSFNPVQCDQRFSLHFAICYCVDKNGDEINGTEVTVGFGQDELPKCGDVKPAQVLTKCEALRLKAQHGPPGTYVPQCRADGSFEPMQCSGSTGYCWCVDKNGNVIPGTMTPPGPLKPVCKDA